MKKAQMLSVIITTGCVLGFLFTSCTPKTEYKREIPVPGAIQKAKGGSVSNFPAVDILFVIDDSGSMSSHQQHLADSTQAFIDAMAKNSSIDYHIAVTTTSVGPSYLNGNFFAKNGNNAIITRNTPGGLLELAENFKVGIGGSGSEAVFDPIMLALDPAALSGANAGWYRPNAFLAIIIVTDTGDQSTTNKVQNVLDRLSALKGGDMNRLMIYGAVASELSRTWTGITCDGETDSQASLEEFFIKTKTRERKALFSLCDPDFSRQFADFGKQIRNKVGRHIYLNKLPVLNTLAVRMGPERIPMDSVKGWTYDPVYNSIVLSDGVDWAKFPDGDKPEVEFIPVGEEED